MARNDGKYLEGEVQDFHKSLEDVSTVLHRFNDSAAARNLTKAQPADFLVKTMGHKPFLLECKSVKHKFRLKKFVQLPRMAKWCLAGFGGKVLVHHWETDKYRVVDIEKLRLGAASYDMRDLPELDYGEAMTEVFNL